MEFRDMLGPSSGFQSLQYRTVEFLMGNKNAAMLKVFAHDAQGPAGLRAVLEAPTTYDASLPHLARSRPAARSEPLQPDGSTPPASAPPLLPSFERLYGAASTHWLSDGLCAALVALDNNYPTCPFR